MNIAESRVYFVPDQDADIVATLIAAELGTEGWERDKQKHYILEEGPYAIFFFDSSVVDEDTYAELKESFRTALAERIEGCHLWS
jgi:hypothetical protein